MRYYKIVSILALFTILIMLLRVSSANAQVSVSGGVSVSGSITIGTPPPVVVAPAPPAVIVQPAPPVIVAPAPPPVVIQPPAPPPPPRVVVKTQMRPPFHRQLGLGLRFGMGLHGGENEEGDAYAMGGGGLLLRLRLLPHFATEIGIDAYGGEGYKGTKRTEVPVTFGIMWMPMYYLTRFQFYTIGGMGVDWAKVGEDEDFMDKPFYVGGFFGIGNEIKLGIRRNFALFWDLRGFIRKRVNDRPDKPYPHDGSCRYAESEKMECTDWEGGATLNFGAVLYF